MKGVKHYKRDGTEHKGTSHKCLTEIYRQINHTLKQV
jgi:hypothetical protein